MHRGAPGNRDGRQTGKRCQGMAHCLPPFPQFSTYSESIFYRISDRLTKFKDRLGPELAADTERDPEIRGSGRSPHLDHEEDTEWPAAARPGKSRILSRSHRLGAQPTIESTFDVGLRFRCTTRVDCGQLDPGTVIQSALGEWQPHVPDRLDEEELADWKAGRNAVYQLAALTIGARLAVADA
jgi:hypothetical protein